MFLLGIAGLCDSFVKGRVAAGDSMPTPLRLYSARVECRRTQLPSPCQALREFARAYALSLWFCLVAFKNRHLSGKAVLFAVDDRELFVVPGCYTPASTHSSCFRFYRIDKFEQQIAKHTRTASTHRQARSHRGKSC